ncbi:hypothetical protein VCHA53O466_50421 [Vibrio chagasii]|nr:hypothetical protein VCHA53O466_50421 [Vibrio chagasii]
MEELHPELACCVHDIGGFKMIKHHFVNTFYDESCNAMFNKQYEHMTKRFNQLIDEGRFSLALTIVDSPFRMDVLKSLLLTDDRFSKSNPDYWDILFDAYRKTEHCSQHAEVWLELMDGANEFPDASMSAGDKSFFESLPQEFTVFRGASRDVNEHGMSFTIDPNTALWFANRFSPDEPVILECLISKDDVIVYSNERGEFEIIVDPDKAEIIKTHEIYSEKQDLGLGLQSKVLLDTAKRCVVTDDSIDEKPTTLSVGFKL